MGSPSKEAPKSPAVTKQRSSWSFTASPASSVSSRGSRGKKIVKEDSTVAVPAMVERKEEELDDGYETCGSNSKRIRNVSAADGLCGEHMTLPTSTEPATAAVPALSSSRHYQHQYSSPRYSPRRCTEQANNSKFKLSPRKPLHCLPVLIVVVMFMTYADQSSSSQQQQPPQRNLAANTPWIDPSSHHPNYQTHTMPQQQQMSASGAGVPPQQMQGMTGRPQPDGAAQVATSPLVKTTVTSWCVLENGVAEAVGDKALWTMYSSSLHANRPATELDAIHTLYSCWSHYERLQEQYQDLIVKGLVQIDCGFWLQPQQAIPEKDAVLFEQKLGSGYWTSHELGMAMQCKETLGDPQPKPWPPTQRLRASDYSTDEKHIVYYPMREPVWFQNPAHAVALRQHVLPFQPEYEREIRERTTLWLSVGFVVMDPKVAANPHQHQSHEYTDILRQLKSVFPNAVIDLEPVSLQTMSMEQQIAWWHAHNLVLVEHTPAIGAGHYGPQVMTNMAYLPLEAAAGGSAVAVLDIDDRRYNAMMQAQQQQPPVPFVDSSMALAKDLGIRHMLLPRLPSNSLLQLVMDTAQGILGQQQQNQRSTAQQQQQKWKPGSIFSSFSN